MEWNSLPGNYEDFQQELEYLSQTITTLKLSLGEFHQLEASYIFQRNKWPNLFVGWGTFEAQKLAY